MLMRKIFLLALMFFNVNIFALYIDSDSCLTDRERFEAAVRMLDNEYRLRMHEITLHQQELAALRETHQQELAALRETLQQKLAIIKRDLVKTERALLRSRRHHETSKAITYIRYLFCS
jgi:hypothetical protein